MYRLRTYTVVPAIPEPIARLRELAYNLWWCWNPEAMELFRRLDTDLWTDVQRNPITFLAHLAQKRLDHAANDKPYLAHLGRVLASFDNYMTRESWFARCHPEHRTSQFSYFSMEFGIHESLPIYSGGLGILAGDHLKSASDLGVPLVGVGLMYRQGYFQQRVSNDGWQLEEYPAIDFFQLPATTVKNSSGENLILTLPIGDRDVAFQTWKVQVGRVPLYLLDTDLKQNAPEDREITSRLYGGDDETRCRQEVVLGIGGIRLLDALGITPDVCHMNEGHAAFLCVERLRQRCIKDKLTFGEAREAVVPSHVFTTHTPIPAGIDRFEDKLLEKYLSPYLGAIGLNTHEFLAMGKKDAADKDEKFSMAIMALRLAGHSNGVSALHGHVSREMWHSVWPGAPRDDVPIVSITNGIHTGSWMAPEMSDLLIRYLGPGWIDNPADHDIWQRVDEIPDLELWRVHERRRIALVAFARQRLKEQVRRRGATLAEVKTADDVLDPEALTIVFARRFAPYKRGSLIFSNPERLLKILTRPDRPVQIIFAGKAHPRDDKGKDIIKEVLANTTKPEYRRRIIFIENYEISVARMLVQGCDIWLNNPIKPREASGTSGMKVAPNGGINLSTLDGWWPEAYDGENGWSIDDGRVYEDQAYGDHIESEAIYDLLEKEIVPLFYERGEDGLPRRWLQRMKSSMQTICPMFNTHRMVEEYADRLYVPAAERWKKQSAAGFNAAKQLWEWKRSLASSWGGLRIESIEANDSGELPVGTMVTVRARVQLGPIKPDSVAVELYHGRLDAHGQLFEGNSEPMSCNASQENGTYLFEGRIPCHRSGQQGYAVRVLPKHEALPHRFDTGLILWS